MTSYFQKNKKQQFPFLPVMSENSDISNGIYTTYCVNYLFFLLIIFSVYASTNSLHSAQ